MLISKVLKYYLLLLHLSNDTNANISKTSSFSINFQVNRKTVLYEYVITFKNYYLEDARKRYLRSALFKVNVSIYEIMPHASPVKLYPSDFDVIRISDLNINVDKLLNLKQHPAIKTIAHHNNLHRNINYYANDNFTDINDGVFSGYKSRKLFGVLPNQITTSLKANILWKAGITGKGIKVAIFDTGLAEDHPHFKRVKERTNWTNEKTLDDSVSHGTFVAGVIASSKECLGLAPDAELHIYRVFTNAQVSYTSWFLDAFNYAIFKKINILNLSIGGPDFLDRPFVDKVLELSANKVIMVSAIGNDGPLYGTLNNPGDQSDVLGVGGISLDEKVAKFSSRGMTTWEMPLGYGRVKPDIVTYGSQVKGSNVHTGCRLLSGTSVASPVVAGAITLITSGALHKFDIVNPSSIKQILIEGAYRLNDNNMFEQGHGKLNILKSMEKLLEYEPKVTLSPSYLDFTENYMWPYSSQPLFCGCMPVIVNVTILNGVSVTGKIAEQPQWYINDSQDNMLKVAISYSSTLWPWSGWMAVHLGVGDHACDFEGSVHGNIVLVVQNPSTFHKNKAINSTVNFPVTVNIIKRPPRHKRIIWDQYHNLRYPPGYIPRDNLKTKSDPLDWRGDHIHTNFRDMYIYLRNSGYYIDVLREPYTCFNGSDYGTLLIVDPEEEFFDEEILKIQNDVYDYGLSLIIFADWYNTTVMKKIKFFDENTRQWWIPDTGGSNIPALNEFLKPFGIAFNDFVADGHFRLGDHLMNIASGTTIANFPLKTDNIIIVAELNDYGAEIMNSTYKIKKTVPVLGLHQSTHSSRKSHNFSLSSFSSSYEEAIVEKYELLIENFQNERPVINKRVLLSTTNDNNSITPLIKYNDNIYEKRSSKNVLEGRIAVFGDSNCLDSAHLEKACFWLLKTMLDYTMNSYKSKLFRNLNRISEFIIPEPQTSPFRLGSSNLYKYSKVLNVKNKYKKKYPEDCEDLTWIAPKLSNFTNFPNNNIYNIHRIYDRNAIRDKLEHHLNLYKSSEITGTTYNALNIFVIFVITITLAAVYIFIKWSKRNEMFK